VGKMIKAIITTTSSVYKYRETRIFNSVEEMWEYMKKTYDWWVVHFNDTYEFGECDVVLEIYDDWRE
jgi:hypothetical protein